MTVVEALMQINHTLEAIFIAMMCIFLAWLIVSFIKW